MIAGVETFVVRIWTPAAADDDPDRYGLRGFVDHVGSGERDAFSSAGELLALLELHVKGKPRRYSDDNRL
jgi:hypothetical protein